MPMTMPIESWRVVLAGALLALALAGCSWLPDGKGRDRELVGRPTLPRSARRVARRELYAGDEALRVAGGALPYGRYAQQAILESAFSNWRAGEQAAAIATCDRFIRTYPNHPNVDYAYYLKGLVHFREDQGVFGYVYELDLSERDPKEMRSSFAAVQGADDALSRKPVLRRLDTAHEAI